MCTVIGEKYPVIEHKMWINVLIKYENKHKRTKTWEIGLTCIDRKSRYTPGYRFTKGLTQNLNLHTNLKLEYNIKSLNYIQQNFKFQASFLFYWTMSF